MKSIPRPLARPNRLIKQRKAHLKALVRDLKKIAHQEIERVGELLEDKEDNPIQKLVPDEPMEYPSKE